MSLGKIVFLAKNRKTLVGARSEKKLKKKRKRKKSVLDHLFLDEERRNGEKNEFER